MEEDQSKNDEKQQFLAKFSSHAPQVHDNAHKALSYCPMNH